MIVLDTSGQASVIILVIDSMTSVSNADASLLYNLDLFQSLIAKERMNVDGILFKNAGSACAMHGLTDAASDAAHVLQWKSPLHNRKLAFRLSDSPTLAHAGYHPGIVIVGHLKTSQFRCSDTPSFLASHCHQLIQLPRYVKRFITSSASP
ncbi:hypothetical protein CSKR_107839 [Clonorchis sinensis]|uniref:Uncharacterized protein n=1 Tax=Clonorchis sinensis TaxID=79923 RepID=A0A3R7GT99_CLOSI|nr:hypothetical protein CSKR_107839 [Clonorchis sinensis]